MPTWLTKDVSLGNLITLLIMLGTFYRFHIANIKRLEKIGHRTAIVWADFCKRHGLQIENEDE